MWHPDDPSDEVKRLKWSQKKNVWRPPVIIFSGCFCAHIWFSSAWGYCSCHCLFLFLQRLLPAPWPSAHTGWRQGCAQTGFAQLSSLGHYTDFYSFIYSLCALILTTSCPALTSPNLISNHSPNLHPGPQTWCCASLGTRAKLLTKAVIMPEKAHNS